MAKFVVVPTQIGFVLYEQGPNGLFSSQGSFVSGFLANLAVVERVREFEGQSPGGLVITGDLFYPGDPGDLGEQSRFFITEDGFPIAEGDDRIVVGGTHWIFGPNREIHVVDPKFEGAPESSILRAA